jgi:hypothetical protein
LSHQPLMVFISIGKQFNFLKKLPLQTLDSRLKLEIRAPGGYVINAKMVFFSSKILNFFQLF